MTQLSDMQRLIVEQLGADRDGRDLLVTAGAGSGKTLVLVESVLTCLKAGTPLNRILVVTFTDKAASEMRNRIYERLGADPDLAPLRLRLPQAWISTIHSFCMRLLRERFERAEVDPRFRVLSQEDARLLLDDALTRVFHESYEAGHTQQGASEAFEELVEMCGFDAGGEKLRVVVRDLLAYARTSEDPGGFLSGHSERLRNRAESWDNLTWAEDYADRVASKWRHAVGLLRAVVAEIESAGKNPGKFAALLGKLEAVDPAALATPSSQVQLVARLAAEGIVADSSQLLVKLASLPRGLGDTLGKLKAKAADAFKCEWLTEMPIDERRILSDERQAARLARSLIGLTQRVWEAYDAAKDRIGRLDFDDLQIRALRLIEETVDTELAVRFDRVFIDEFQDVNALQDRILSLVSTSPWVFRVGDIKQSIYQFRLANPKIIRALARQRPPVKERNTAPEESTAWNVLLPTNYRSLSPILAIAEPRGILLIEDASHAHGATYRGQKAGTFGKVGCFSCGPVKNLGSCGDGGFIATHDPDVAAKVRLLQAHGQAKKNQHELYGFNSRLDELQAVVLRAKLKRLDARNARRVQHADRYSAALGPLGIITPPTLEDRTCVYHQYVIRTAGRDRLAAFLKERGVGTGVYYHFPVHKQPPWKRTWGTEPSLPVSEKVAGEILALPVYPDLTDEEIEYVIGSVRAWVEGGA